ncbi:MAG: glycosyltransferase [Saprospiraceae bacterium]
MIWLASFPRSGNTFFRNVLFEVYGVSSSTYHQHTNRKLDADFSDYEVVKTHLLPADLPADLRDLPAVYIIRDGRDALVSIAHHRKDIVAPGTDYYNNLVDAILAQRGSFFGGWSKNVQQWTDRAAIVIRFEDLIADPIREVEKLRAIMPLPQPDLEKLPTFKDMKFGRPRYGGGKGKHFKTSRAEKHFRKGRVGGWQDEMSPILARLAWSRYGADLAAWGYEPQGEDVVPPTRRVLIESSKLYGTDNDGVKRYVAELVAGLTLLLPLLPEWQIEIYDRRGIQPLVQPFGKPVDQPETDFRTLSKKEMIQKDRRTMDYEKWLLLVKEFAERVLPTHLYSTLAHTYRKGPIRKFLNRFKLRARKLIRKLTDEEILAQVARADLIHLPLPQHFTEISDSTTPTLVTVHDLTHRILPQFHTTENSMLAETGMTTLLGRGAHVLAVSQSTRRDVLKYYDLPETRLHTVYEAANLSLYQPANREKSIPFLRKKYGLPTDSPYLLCLSTIEPRKNLRNTLLAFLQLKTERPDLATVLVICGKKGWKTEDLFTGIDLERPDIVFTGFVDDAHLPFLYAHARALCYVSFYEGFGLPILEAMASGTPVVYGNNSAMPEVAGDGGLPADPNDVADIKNQLLRILTDDELWQEKSTAAFAQANKFSWLKTALKTLEVYERVIQAET